MDGASSERALVIERLIDAPREAVFRAWTERLPEWWEPLHGAGDVEFLEVTPPSRIVLTDAFSEPRAVSGRAFMVAVVTFEERGGKTLLTAKALHWAEDSMRLEAAVASLLPRH